MQMYENKKILILGAARSGISVAKLLAPKNKIVLSDMKPLALKDQEELEKLNVEIIITENQIDLINSSYDFVIKNPAIMATSVIVKKINDLGIKLVNEIEVAYHFLPKNVRIIGITGSNGKTTVTTMIYELLKKLGVSVVLGGNIGLALSQIVADVKENDTLVLELSDHQLNDIKDFKTNISVVTNISPAHLDYHGSYDAYKKAKMKIFNKHTKEDLAILNKKNSDSLEISQNTLSQKLYFNDDTNYYNNEGIYLNGEKVLSLADILVKGNHNYENVLATLLVVKNFAWNLDVIKNYFQNFGGVAHRLELVKVIDDVTYYNDSKSTNTAATITALKTFNKPIHLILGGVERNQDFHDLDPFMDNVKWIYAIGTTTKRVGEYAQEIKKNYSLCETLAKAMDEIFQNVEKGDIVLLSPASSSQDFYVKFEDRGDEFKNIVAKKS